MTTVEHPTQQQVAPTPVGRQLPIPDHLLAQLQEGLGSLLAQAATQLAGMDIDLGTASTEDAQQVVLAMMTDTEAAIAFLTARQAMLAQLAKKIGISDARRGEACGITEEAARRRAKRGTQQ